MDTFHLHRKTLTHCILATNDLKQIASVVIQTQTSASNLHQLVCLGHLSHRPKLTPRMRRVEWNSQQKKKKKLLISNHNLIKYLLIYFDVLGHFSYWTFNRGVFLIDRNKFDKKKFENLLLTNEIVRNASRF